MAPLYSMNCDDEAGDQMFMVDELSMYRKPRNLYKSDQDISDN